MKGELYGIGTGPGDPELLTLKAVQTIKNCHVIAVPSTGNGDGAALTIVREYIKGKPLIECPFSMEKNPQKRELFRIKAADSICQILDTGLDVGFITLGDPTVYSTYMYIHKLVVQRGFSARIIPGIPSFTAAAGVLGTPLCEGNEALLIIPASDNDNLINLLSVPANKVIMKSGGNLDNVLSAIRELGLSENVKIVERCTMDDQQIFNSVEEIKNAGGTGYFSVILAKGDL